MFVYNYYDGSDRIKFKDMTASNVVVSVYAQVKDNKYKLLENIEDDDTEYNVEVRSYNAAIIVVRTIDFNTLGKFQIKAEAWDTKDLTTGAIIGIVLGCVAFVVI